MKTRRQRLGGERHRAYARARERERAESFLTSETQIKCAFYFIFFSFSFFRQVLGHSRIHLEAAGPLSLAFSLIGTSLSKMMTPGAASSRRTSKGRRMAAKASASKARAGGKGAGLVERRRKTIIASKNKTNKSGKENIKVKPKSSDAASKRAEELKRSRSAMETVSSRREDQGARNNLATRKCKRQPRPSDPLFSSLLILPFYLFLPPHPTPPHPSPAGPPHGDGNKASKAPRPHARPGRARRLCLCAPCRSSSSFGLLLSSGRRRSSRGSSRGSSRIVRTRRHRRRRRRRNQVRAAARRAHQEEPRDDERSESARGCCRRGEGGDSEGGRGSSSSRDLRQKGGSSSSSSSGCSAREERLEARGPPRLAPARPRALPAHAGLG